jgi:hypothetical protein
MVSFIENTYGLSDYVNFYCELYLSPNYQYSQPTQIKLVNPIFNSFNEINFSKARHYNGGYQFITTSANTLFFNNSWDEYYSATTSNDITKNIYDIISNEATFYGPLYGSAQNAMTYPSWDNTGREIIQNSVFVEHLTNFYSKYKIPVNLYKGFRNSYNRYNNFDGELLYDIVGGSSPTLSIYASAPTYGSNSTSFLNLVDTYRILPNGNKFVIYGRSEEVYLSGLTYVEYQVKDWKYLNGIYRSYYLASNYQGSTGVQVLPGYNEVYTLEVEVVNTPGNVDTQTFLNDLLTNYFVANDPSVSNTNITWSTYTLITSNAVSYLSGATSFNSNPYGPYIIIQSNDTKMLTLSANSSYVFAGGEINIKSIYKGYTFRPEIYPLNLTQLILEVPESFFYDGSNLQPSENSTNNVFELSGVDITNKKLRLIIKYTKINKWELLNANLKYTTKRSGFDSNIFTLTFDLPFFYDSFESLIATQITRSRISQLRPGSVEIYFSFYDTNTFKTSLITDYKIVMVRYGDNEIFKLIRSDNEINIVAP